MNGTEDLSRCVLAIIEGPGRDRCTLEDVRDSDNSLGTIAIGSYVDLIAYAARHGGHSERSHGKELPR